MKKKLLIIAIRRIYKKYVNTANSERHKLSLMDKIGQLTDFDLIFFTLSAFILWTK